MRATDESFRRDTVSSSTLVNSMLRFREVAPALKRGVRSAVTFARLKPITCAMVGCG